MFSTPASRGGRGRAYRISPGIYADATHVPQITLDEFGRIKKVANVSITGGTGNSALVLLEEHTASNSASLNFTTSISSTYDNYLIQILNLVPVTNSVGLLLRFSTNSGSTYDSGTNYRYVWFRSTSSGVSEGGGTGKTGIRLDADNTYDNTASEGGLIGSWQLFSPLSGTSWTRLNGTGSLVSGGTDELNIMMGTYAVTTAVNAFQLLMSSGNISSGIVRCYGLTQ